MCEVEVTYIDNGFSQTFKYPPAEGVIGTGMPGSIIVSQSRRSLIVEIIEEIVDWLLEDKRRMRLIGAIAVGIGIALIGASFMLG